MSPAADEPDAVRAEAPSARRRHPAWDLLWTVPVALVVSVLPVGWASLAWCGVWGCADGPRGDVRDVIGPALVVGALVGAAVVIVPWTDRRPRRALVSAGVGFVVTALTLLWVVLR
ncbi:MAG: hypothetical protein ABW025_03585 [Cellulomonas sp.]